MDDSYYIDSQFHIPSYSELHTQPEIIIHPNSTAAQLGLTPAELVPILREQQEYLRDEVAQPPPTFTRPTTVHLIPATEQLGLTTEEVEEVLQDQKDWMRAEEEQRHEMSERSTTRAQHPPSPTTRYQIPTPTAHPKLNQEVYEGYGMTHEPAIATTSYDDNDDVSNRGDTPWYQPPIPIQDNAYPAPQLEHNGYDTANEYDGHVVPFDWGYGRDGQRER
jgi:hypothetical protein